jgi:rod shape-determining protein MreD
MRSEYIAAILLFFPLLLIQTTIIPLVSIAGVVPDLILILLVYYTIRTGQIQGTVLGFVYGFFFDLITGSLIGSSMLSKTFTGFIAGYFSNENKRELYIKSYIFPLIIFLCSTIDSFILSFFSTIDLSKNLLVIFFEQGMFPGFYTAMLSLIVVVFHPRKSFA